ncbi:MAG: hypothetical protein FWD57_14050, partial [Polyangiaceae bacterium]|nr:hypothetical protein [Polyangiaceae bacterium]
MKNRAAVFDEILMSCRDISDSGRDRVPWFAKLMVAFLKAHPQFAHQFAEVWFWEEFPSAAEFGAANHRSEIDIVARTKAGEYCAVRSICVDESAAIGIADVEPFLCGSAKPFKDALKGASEVRFASRLWIDTAKKGFDRKAKSAICKAIPPVFRLGYTELVSAHVDWAELANKAYGRRMHIEPNSPRPHRTIPNSNLRSWEHSAKDVARIAHRHIELITAMVSVPGAAQAEFERFVSGLRQSINSSVTDQDAIEMLAQHIITQPVFEALFEDYYFVKNNAVSKSLQASISIINERTDPADAELLESFYSSVRLRVHGIKNGEAKQNIIVELYEKFFRTAFRKVTEKLGIVYTPVEIVDFIILSVEDVLHREFGRSMTDENVHILDPFAGTGTFITRLLQSGIIKREDLNRKYLHELHANEIVLLAYYVASINIEYAYHDLVSMPEPYPKHSVQECTPLLMFANSDPRVRQLPTASPVEEVPRPLPASCFKRVEPANSSYLSFPGIRLTDTFQSGETLHGERVFGDMFVQNSDRIWEQRNAPLRVIIGNPPYSIGQKSANDNAQNQKYANLEKRIRETYVAESKAILNRAAYDTYIKALRWASDRLDTKDGGVIAFITNNCWLEGNGLDGFRRCIASEFSSVYVLNLRGAVRGRGSEAVRKEGGNVFDIMTGVAITILVKLGKDVRQSDRAEVLYMDIGDYLSREDKLQTLRTEKCIGNMKSKMHRIEPNAHGDWINIRSGIFDQYIPLEPEKKCDGTAHSFFSTYAVGVVTSRDAFVYGFSRTTVE